ncbi:Transcription factor cheR [Cladobotryum mycophilum]|uniref:Transcription factor cheR n=1 Tax=Cladobotryum mycophilum TaxID=491253 RepID=A0ABR0SVT4_9HYPO
MAAPAPATANFFSAARSRRLACDRCHRHKLRCERSPIVVNGSIAIPLGTCKRCQKARVSCQTTAGTFTGGPTNITNIGSALKRNASMLDGDKSNIEDMPNLASLNAASTTNSKTSAAINNNSTNNNENAMWDSPMFSGDDASTLLDLDNFDFGTDDFASIEGAPTTVSPPQSKSPALSSNNNTWDTVSVQDEPKNGYKTPIEDFVDSTYFGSTPQQLNDSSTSSLSTSVSDDSKMILQPEHHAASPRDDCRRRLLELHSLLFNELQCITDADLAEALFSHESTSLASREKPGPGDSVVRRVLFASERLIELLGNIGSAYGDQQLMQQKFRERPSSSSTLSRASASMPASSLRFHRNSTSASSTGSVLRNSLRGGCGNPSGGATGGHGLSGQASSFVNLPLTISFLTCYVSLLSVYRSIFTHIYEALSALDPSHQHHHHHQVAQRGRGWSVNGSAAQRAGQGMDRPVLRQEHVLGIRIQMEVMTHMLERVDDAWAAAVVDEPERGGMDVDQLEDGRAVFGRSATTALLQSMLIHEGFDFTDDGFSMGLGSLMVIQKSIRRLLRSSTFA